MARRYQRGCVFKRGKRRKVWVGRWREDVIDRDGSLGRVQRSAVLGLVSDIPTKHEALTLLEERLRLMSQTGPGFRVPLRFDAFYGEWQKTVLPLLRPATRAFYKEKAERHLVPYFGNWRLTDIRTLDIQVFLNQKAERYARSVLQHFKATLSRMFSDAVAWGYLRENPVRNIKLPDAGEFRPQPYLTAGQVRKLVSILNDPYRTIVITAVLTGLRPSELFALAWSDVNFENRTIQVNRSCYRGEFGKTKTSRSRRMLAMPPLLVEVFLEHRSRTSDGAGELVFSTRTGKPHDPPEVLKRAIHPALARLGLPRVGWLAFRHTVATLLQHLGESVKVAQEQLGHSNPYTTLSVYTHVLPEAQREAVDRLAQELFPNVPN